MKHLCAIILLSVLTGCSVTHITRADGTEIWHGRLGNVQAGKAVVVEPNGTRFELENLNADNVGFVGAMTDLGGTLAGLVMKFFAGGA